MCNGSLGASAPMLSLLFALVSTGAPTGLSTHEEVDFEGYAKLWNKEYATDERAARQKLFEASKAQVVAHNREYHAGRESWWMTLNEWADRSPDEFNKLRGTKMAPDEPSAWPTRRAGGNGVNPAEVDWRAKGAVSKVKNQGACGSCWAFSATESLESHYQLASGTMLDLAPQTLVDCVQNPQQCGGTGGCEGATMELGFNLTVKKGIALESDLPYKATDQSCPTYTAAVKASGYVKNPVNDAMGLETALAQVGPISVTVAAGAWQLYGGGIFNKCSKKRIFGHPDNTLDHGVQAVGYTADYWCVWPQNSNALTSASHP